MFSAVVAVPTAAFAYWHTDTNLPPANTREVRGGVTFDCADCHVTWTEGTDPLPPGGEDPPPGYATAGAGPHGYYRADADKCQMCHIVHQAPANSYKLLPAPTIQAACFTCHDATGAEGVYSGITARGGSVVASHSIDATTNIPGGSFDLTAKLGCTSCHAVHRATTMAPFRTDRQRTPGDMGGAKYTNQLLRDDVGGKARGTYTKYGSDWCAGCHDERHSDSTIINHPVETSTTPGAFNYGRVATVLDASSSQTEILDSTSSGTGLGYTNYGYVMPYPRTAQQGVHKPICQQCHEDGRPVGNVGAVVDHPENWPGPQTGQLDFAFPHQATTRRMLVEEHDDLCMNCHPVAQLP